MEIKFFQWEVEMIRSIIITILAATLWGEPFRYCVVVSENTLNDPNWGPVVDTLIARYGGRIFTHTGDPRQVKDSLVDYQPSHVCFVYQVSEITSYGCLSLVTTINQMLRQLDSDPYGDARWGILTGYDANDAMRIATEKPKNYIYTAILKDCGGLLKWVKQGIYFACHQYHLVKLKRAPCETVETYYDGPTDCTDTICTLINNDTFDIIMPAGHGNHNAWQLHYPYADSEGFIRSANGQVYGDPYSGSNININSTNAKVFYSPYNCYHGLIQGTGSFVPSWFHTGGACQFYGNTKPVAYEYMGGASHFYLWPMQGRFTFAEIQFLTNQQLLFCLFNNKPGTNPSGLNYDKDSWCLYGNPAQEFRIYQVTSPYYRKPWCTFDYSIRHGQSRDTVTFKITVQYDSTKPWRSYGEPVIDFLPFKAESIEIISTNAHDAVVTDNFVLLNVWNIGDPYLREGETREVVFAVNSIPEVAELPSEKPMPSITVYPNPFRNQVNFRIDAKHSGIKVKIFDANGRLIKVLPEGKFTWRGETENGREAPPGIYFYRVERVTGKLIKVR